MSASVLLVRCPTWEHVENFYQRKVKEGRLSARVPFRPDVGSVVSLHLELPDNEVIECPADVLAVQPAADGRRFAVVLGLEDFESGLRARLESVVGGARDGAASAFVPDSEETPRPPRTRSGVSVPVPADAPIDERVEPERLAEVDEVAAGVREMYRGLLTELQAIQSRAAHEVLGVGPDATVEEVRRAYFELTKRYHPDLYSRHRSPDVALLVSEVFIHINRAYDRMRESAVASGRAIAAGPALLAHDGWFAGFEDLGTVRPRRPLRQDEVSAAPQVELPSVAPTAMAAESALREEQLFDDVGGPDDGRTTLDFGSAATGAGGIDIGLQEREGRVALSRGNYEAAGAHFALILEHAPRARQVRALYHLAYGHTLQAQGDAAGALAQFETALSHDPDCVDAEEALARVTPQRPRRQSLLRRLFRR